MVLLLPTIAPDCDRFLPVEGDSYLGGISLTPFIIPKSKPAQ
ncbi:MAG: hypothetical protein A4E62_02763 [Syntrophorhabdus sp. PtaU1.Bin002]|nr:MAG: hypothetical protein A4E62_02763 [Syntrophorhabdus sp. PtaU1.Bin002]